jgi:hypothetical protein
MKRMRLIAIALALLTLSGSIAARQLKTPADWKWRFDGGTGTVVETEPRGNEMQFVAMPPGWHVTTGPAALLYHPDYQAKGNFSVEAEIFLFPGQSQEEYGIFLGGKSLLPTERPSYTAFVARRDGMGAIRRGSGEPIVAWKANDAIAPHPGKDEAVKNILRVDAGAAEIVFTANGKEVARIPRTSTNLDGHFGFRFGKDVNVHASRLVVTHRLAPVPIKKG